MLRDIGKMGNKDIILIDASKKMSASKVTDNEFNFGDGFSDTIDNMNAELEDTIDKIGFELPQIC